MRTTFVMDPPPIVQDWLAQRSALGQDLFDEVWEGEYHVAASPSDRHADLQVQLIVILRPLAQRTGLLTRGPSNIGRPTDFRVPDLAFLGGVPEPVWQPGAAIVVEIQSPGDETRAKLGFYHRVGVEEILIVDPDTRAVEWFGRGPDAFLPAHGIRLLGITSTELAAAIDWPD
jgi:Uma2 family endonuclease